VTTIFYEPIYYLLSFLLFFAYIFANGNGEAMELFVMVYFYIIGLFIVPLLWSVFLTICVRGVQKLILRSKSK